MKKTQKNIEDQYIDYILTHNKRPFTVYSFTKELNIKESDFYNSYSSFYAIEKKVWKEIISQTIQSAKKQEEYENYSVREKLLSFYFTLVEELKKNRSFVIFSTKKQPLLSFLDRAGVLTHFKSEFLEYAQEIIQEGIHSGEVESRMLISDYYSNVLWYQMTVLLNFWIKDDSESFESTDAAIEKAVNLSFDLLGSNFLDSFFDTGKFFLLKS